MGKSTLQKSTLIAFVLFFIFCGIVSAGQNLVGLDLSYQKAFWVDGVAGSNGNDGISSSTPVKTIQRALDLLTAAKNTEMVFIKASGDYELTETATCQVTATAGWKVLSGYGTTPGDGVKAVINDLGNKGSITNLISLGANTRYLFNSLDLSISGSSSAVVYGTYNGAYSCFVDSSLKGHRYAVNFTSYQSAKFINCYLENKAINSSYRIFVSSSAGLFYGCYLKQPSNSSGAQFAPDGSEFINCVLDGGRHVCGSSNGAIINCVVYNTYLTLFSLNNNGLAIIMNSILNPSTSGNEDVFSNVQSLYIGGGNIYNTEMDSSSTAIAAGTQQNTSKSDIYANPQISPEWRGGANCKNKAVNFLGTAQDSGALQSGAAGATFN
jgi:hypothetical protein